MSSGLYTQLLNVACGAFLLAAVVVLWRRELAAIVRVFALQGVALAAVAVLLGAHEERWDLIAVGIGIGLLRAGVLPYLMRRALTALTADGQQYGQQYGQRYGTGGAEARETQPLVNVAASLLTASLLTLLAYVVSLPLTELDPTPATRALPVGLAVVLIGFFVLVTRRRALAQVVGFLLLDNGITATAFLAASGVPLIVELGVSFDVLLAVLVLQILTTRMREAFGTTDIDDLQELHD
jgi:hydrogenase-4 component E